MIAAHTALDVVAGVAADVGVVTLDEVTRGVLPFMTAQFAVMFQRVFFPQRVIVPAKRFPGRGGAPRGVRGRPGGIDSRRFVPIVIGE